jgi:hypothetical protein
MQSKRALLTGLNRAMLYAQVIRGSCCCSLSSRRTETRRSWCSSAHATGTQHCYYHCNSINLNNCWTECAHAVVHACEKCTQCSSSASSYAGSRLHAKLSQRERACIRSTIVYAAISCSPVLDISSVHYILMIDTH